MFVGHYAPVFALRAVRKTPGLAAGFLAVQLVDIAFFSLSYVGIEKWAANPSLKGFMPIDLYYMPITHSLAGSVSWGVFAGIVAASVSPAGRRFGNAIAIGLFVVSHWFLDLIVHRHDLPLLGDSGEKFGFGLWDHPLAVIPLEMGLLFAGFSLYMSRTTATGVMGRIAPWAVLALLCAAQFINWFTPTASDAATFSGMGLAAYLGLAGIAWLLDRARN